MQDEKDGKENKFMQAAQIYQAAGGSQEGALGGAMSGAMTGASLGGGPGAVIGGAAGALMGIAKSRAARKAHNAQVESNKIQRQGDIERDKQQQIGNALAMMGQRMSLR
jgi:outer membrane lipoprotein SlyB